MPGLFVAPVPFEAQPADIDDLFKDHGKVTDIQFKKGYGANYIFVELETDELAQQAIRDLDGRRFFGKELAVKPAKGIGPGKGYRGGSDTYDPNYVEKRREEEAAYKERKARRERGGNYAAGFLNIRFLIRLFDYLVRSNLKFRLDLSIIDNCLFNLFIT